MARRQLYIRLFISAPASIEASRGLYAAHASHFSRRSMIRATRPVNRKRDAEISMSYAFLIEPMPDGHYALAARTFRGLPLRRFAKLRELLHSLSHTHRDFHKAHG